MKKIKVLAKEEEEYLARIPINKKIKIYPFDPKAKMVGNFIVSRIKRNFPQSKVLFMGATALEITGQNDVDIYMLAKAESFDNYLSKLKDLFGEPIHIHETFIEWGFTEKGYPIQVYLADPTSSSRQRQIKVFEILKNNPKPLREYESFKLKFNGKKFRDYQKAKYEFYNRILASEGGF